MSSKTRIVLAPGLVLGIGLIVQGVGFSSAEAGGGVSAPQVLNVDRLTKQQLNQQLKRLPDGAVIESQGQRMTVAQIRALAVQKGQRHQAKAQDVLNQARVAFRQDRAQFDQQQRAKLAADNVKAMAEFARLSQAAGSPRSPQLEAIEQEAAQLWQRAERASPAERARIEQRAAQLLQQLER
jgi:hypothetical protein